MERNARRLAKRLGPELANAAHLQREFQKGAFRRCVLRSVARCYGIPNAIRHHDDSWYRSIRRLSEPSDTMACILLAWRN